MAAGGEELHNTTCSYIFNAAHFYVLKDGSFLILNDIGTSQHSPFFIIDVNGKKGPNKWGYDLFYLTFSRENDLKNVVISNGLCAIKEKDGFFLKDVLLK